jgi:glycosyltransferase involved in cell wall biosynthesis
MRQYYQNWLSIDDITNLLFLNDYEVVRKGYRFLFPIYIPLISGFINKYIARLPFIKKLCLVWFVVAKQKDMPSVKKDYTCSIVVPCKNEFGNIEDLITRTPNMGRGTEIIFVDGNSSDGTVDKIKEMIQKYPDKKIKLLYQGTGTGKADAVRKGFEAAVNEILIILDADLTVPPEDLVKFYLVLAENKAEFVNGTRLVYPLEKESMRVLNILGNKIFSLIFTWILEQRVKDTLCGTKALFKEDYELIKRERKYFGDFDPFGDFDLIFGAAKLNLKMVEIPVRYKKRKYGSTKISRLRHGLSLLRMSFLAFKKF